MSRGQTFALIATLVIASGFVDFRIRQFPEHSYTQYIPEVTGGTADAPGKYRVLVPFLHAWLVQWTGASDELVWHVTRLAWFLAAYAAIYGYLQLWVDPTAALGGVTAVAATLPLTYTNSWAHPDSVPELALFTLGCWAIIRGSVIGLVPVLAVAALNRETSGFLLVTFLCSRRWHARHLLQTAGLAVMLAALLGALRLVRGVEHYDYWQLGRNLAFLQLLPSGYDLYKRLYAWFIVALAAPAVFVTAS
jgi:hypothetical protein